MASGKVLQRMERWQTSAAGEYLVAAELSRRGWQVLMSPHQPTGLILLQSNCASHSKYRSRQAPGPLEISHQTATKQKSEDFS